MVDTWIDVVLVATFLWLAWSSLTSADIFKGVVLFIAFGLTMSLVWVRLEAPDVAIAEAAIGTGLTGALFLDAVRHFNQPPGYRTPDREEVTVEPGDE